MRRFAGLAASGGLPSFQSSSGAFRLLCPLEPLPFLPPPAESVFDEEEEGAEALGSSLSEAGLKNCQGIEKLFQVVYSINQCKHDIYL